jgi:GAF domain-containing protein
MRMAYQPGEALPGQVFASSQPLRLDEIDFARHYNLSPENLRHFRDATGGLLPVSSLAIPIGGTPANPEGGKTTPPLGVLVLDNPKTTAAFSGEDQVLVSSLAQQTALILENARLFQASERRAHQLQALTEVATTITSSLQPDELVSTLLDQLQAILPYETGTLWLLRRGPDGASPGDNPRQTMVVSAARGFTDSDQRIGLTVAVEDSVLLNEMIHTSQPLSVANVCDDSRFSPLMEYERLSWLGCFLFGSRLALRAHYEHVAGFDLSGLGKYEVRESSSRVK